MNLKELRGVLSKHAETFPRFILPNGGYIPAHAHVTEIGYVVKNYIDCGGLGGKEEKVVLQTHVGNDTEHRLRSDRFSKIVELGKRVLPNEQLEVEVEYNCCVVAQYPIEDAKLNGQHLELMLGHRRTHCRAAERPKTPVEEPCCGANEACC
jgi:Family of unknown function (DUF6428)